MVALGIFLVVYGVFCIFMGITKQPAVLWKMGKIQGFVKMMGEKGTRIFFSIWGLAAIVIGIILLVNNA